MKSSPKSVGLFVALVVSTLLLVGWPEPADRIETQSPVPVADEEPDQPVFEVDGDVWILPQHGLRMPLPTDWTPLERFGRPYVCRDPESMRAGNINVLWLPNLRGLDYRTLAEENRNSLETNEELELISMEQMVVTDLPALTTEYRGTPNGGEAMHFLGVVFLVESRQIVVTASAREEDWPELESTFRACLGSLARLD
jgi:hypothetical protein